MSKMTETCDEAHVSELWLLLPEIRLYEYNLDLTSTTGHILLVTGLSSEPKEPDDENIRCKTVSVVLTVSPGFIGSCLSPASSEMMQRGSYSTGNMVFSY